MHRSTEMGYTCQILYMHEQKWHPILLVLAQPLLPSSLVKRLTNPQQLAHRPRTPVSEQYRGKAQHYGERELAGIAANSYACLLLEPACTRVSLVS